ncbi:hypothetical protein ACM44_02210 [Chryseobacterium koreense CCUG 49689]|uniref:Uncharacterized protein n=1 Tax=Chryseobacterium koreense CCUG 49689 TaxID=1304281 RepID=A0A0J7J2J7_9FLAO|nr:hypothetical protein ACM44_02210 [Chryseobacterium koreense CCUG 49689]
MGSRTAILGSRTAKMGCRTAILGSGTPKMEDRTAPTCYFNAWNGLKIKKAHQIGGLNLF